nr:MAG TPA: hypothetical protein [Caudoviricetes sp.]
MVERDAIGCSFVIGADSSKVAWKREKGNPLLRIMEW